MKSEQYETGRVKGLGLLEPCQTPVCRLRLCKPRFDRGPRPAPLGPTSLGVMGREAGDPGQVTQL